jgi:hypothetical protein
LPYSDPCHPCSSVVVLFFLPSHFGNFGYQSFPATTIFPDLLPHFRYP